MEQNDIYIKAMASIVAETDKILRENKQVMNKLGFCIGNAGALALNSILTNECFNELTEQHWYNLCESFKAELIKGFEFTLQKGPKNTSYLT